MKIFLIIIFFAGVIFAQENVSPHLIVDKQLEAYNNRDIDTFVNTYHDSVEIYKFPGVLSYKGKEILRERYGKMFASLKKLNAVSLNRIILNNKVVDHEEASRYKNSVDKPDAVNYVIVTYEIEDNLIKKVMFCR